MVVLGISVDMINDQGLTSWILIEKPRYAYTAPVTLMWSSADVIPHDESMFKNGLPDSRKWMIFHDKYSIFGLKIFSLFDSADVSAYLGTVLSSVGWWCVERLLTHTAHDDFRHVDILTEVHREVRHF